MHAELADHICLIAAPIYAALLTRALATGAEIPADVLSDLRRHAITQALALRLDALEMPAS
jgi:hypothetical protein